MRKTSTGRRKGTSPREIARGLLAGGLIGGIAISAFLPVGRTHSQPVFVIIAIVLGVCLTCAAVFGPLMLRQKDVRGWERRANDGHDAQRRGNLDGPPPRRT